MIKKLNKQNSLVLLLVFFACITFFKANAFNIIFGFSYNDKEKNVHINSAIAKSISIFRQGESNHG